MSEDTMSHEEMMRNFPGVKGNRLELVLLHELGSQRMWQRESDGSWRRLEDGT